MMVFDTLGKFHLVTQEGLADIRLVGMPFDRSKNLVSSSPPEKDYLKKKFDLKEIVKLIVLMLLLDVFNNKERA